MVKSPSVHADELENRGFTLFIPDSLQTMFGNFPPPPINPIFFYVQGGTFAVDELGYQWVNTKAHVDLTDIGFLDTTNLPTRLYITSAGPQN